MSESFASNRSPSQIIGIIKEISSSGLLTKALNACYTLIMWRSLISVITLTMILSVQAFGMVCETKCSLQEVTKVSDESKDQSHHDCHSKGEETESSESDECGSRCKSDDLYSDSKVLEFERPLRDSLIPSIGLFNIIYTVDRELISNISTHDPPGVGFYSGVPIYIQKSSYIIEKRLSFQCSLLVVNKFLN